MHFVFLNSLGKKGRIKYPISRKFHWSTPVSVTGYCDCHYIRHLYGECTVYAVSRRNMERNTKHMALYFFSQPLLDNIYWMDNQNVFMMVSVDSSGLFMSDGAVSSSCVLS